MKQKENLYRNVFASLKNEGYFILTDYFADNNFCEEENFLELKKLKEQLGINNDEFYHYDTPLTLDHERECLLKAGFSKVEVLKSWSATSVIKADR